MHVLQDGLGPTEVCRLVRVVVQVFATPRLHEVVVRLLEQEEEVFALVDFSVCGLSVRPGWDCWDSVEEVFESTLST